MVAPSVLFTKTCLTYFDSGLNLVAHPALHTICTVSSTDMRVIQFRLLWIKTKNICYTGLKKAEM